MNLDLSYYFAVFLRRIHYFLLCTAIVSAVAVAAALLLPPSYKANALLVLESSSIPGQLAAPTVQAADLEKLQLIENRLMTRANLLDVSSRLNVFRDFERMAPDDIVTAMRDATTIRKNAAKNEATTMSISFAGESGRVAAAVVNEFVTQILKEDVDQRTRSAEGTVEFFEQEVQRLGAELDELNAKVLEFQNANSDALPSTLTFRMTQQSQLQTKLDLAEQNIRQLQDQKDQLIAIYKATGQVGSTGAPQTPEARQLAALQDQLTQNLSVLAPDNPKIKLLQAQIAGLEEIVKNQTTQALGDPNTTMYDAMISDMDAKIEAAIQARDQMVKQMADLQDSIDRTPGNQIALDALLRDLANIQQQYNQAQGALSQASAGERIAVLSKGERISVLDAATVPNSPDSPNRPLIVAGGVGAGMMLGIGLIVLLELLNRSVRRPKDIVRAFGITPIVTIPYMRTPSETMRIRSTFVMMMLVAVVGVPAAIYAVHVYYLPLELILDRAAAKIGINL